MIDITVIKGGTGDLVHIASTVGEVRKVVNDMSTKHPNAPPAQIMCICGRRAGKSHFT
jgi:hypothetical protein